jgi:hypothetical protein
MIRFFVSVTLPSLLVATVWMGALGFWATRKIRGYQRERCAVHAQRRSLKLAQDALATAISDSLASGSTRELALPAYEALGRLLQEREIS